MDRNRTSVFVELPEADISRSKFDRSHSVKFTGNVGQLIPFLVEEVLPGDTFSLTTSKVLRLQTLIHPLMDDLYLDTYYFFVPNRLVWEHWKEFCGENTQSAWIPQVEYSIPQVILDSASTAPGSVADYFGIPQVESGSINALPFRAYALIYNDWFRDQNLIDPLNIPVGDADTSLAQALGGSAMPLVACKSHDYFTSCLPGPQKGPDVTFSLGGDVPVTSPSVLPVYTYNQVFEAPGISWENRMPALYATKSTGDTKFFSNTYYQSASSSAADGPVNSLSGSVSALDGNSFTAIPANFGVNLEEGTFTADFSSVTSITVNDLRMSFQIQKYYEKLARGGSRYTEILRSMFGVTSPDSRLQRPEYLGGDRMPISIHQVVNQTENAEGDGLGNLGAFSMSSDVNDDFTKSFVEHGFVIGLAVVRYEHTYAQGAERLFFRKNRFDYYWPVFANIGEQPVFKREIYFTGSATDDDVFGYQEAWADYRYKPNRVAGEMRPGIPNTLASWNLADEYSTVPYLSESWIREDLAPVDRALAVTSSAANQYLADFYIRNEAVRPMPLYSVPGLIDHH